MENIQALVIGGIPLIVRRSGGAFELGAPFITSFANELNEAFTSLAGRFYDIVLLNAVAMGSRPQEVIARLTSLSPLTSIIVFDEDDNEGRILSIMKSGASECLTSDESSINGLRRNIFKVLERSEGGVWLAGQISETLLTSTFEGTIVVDNHMRVLLWNPAMERIFEVDRTAITGKVLAEALPFLVEGEESEERSIQEALNGKRIVTRERYFYNPDTEKSGFFTAFYNPMRNRRGEIVGVVGIVKDVTKNKLNERTSFEMAQRMLALTNSSSNMQWISDCSENRIFFNKRWLDFVGNDIDDERGCGWRRHVHAEDLRRYRQITEAAFDSRLPWHIEVRLKGSDGRYTRFFESAFPLFLSDQSFIGYAGYCTDINAGRPTNPRIPALYAATQTFNSLEMSPIGIVNLDNTMVIRNANKRVADLFAIPVEKLIGQKISDVLGAFDMTTLQVVLDRGEKIQLENHKVSIETDSGESVRYWDIACWPQKDVANKTTGVCMSFIEATERYTDSKQKEEFVAALVHDLKTPLIGAQRTLDAMLKGSLGPVESGHARMLSVLQNSNSSLLTMVQSMIDMHRCESDYMNLSLQSMKISGLVQECIEELRVLFNSHGIQLRYVNSATESVSVMADRMAVRRVILNLLDNALKFTPYSGTVSVALRCENDTVLLDIADTGIGIPEEDQEKIFGKSFQGAVGRQMGASAGIGLFVCRKIIRAHSGEISVVRNFAGGSTFTITLPKQNAGALVADAVPTSL